MRKILLSYFLFSLSGVVVADINSLLQSPQGNISSNVWSNAVTSYLSQCAGGQCPCVLVVAEGIQGNNTSTNMWIGSFKEGMVSELWSGYGSRLANSGQNDESVSMDTGPCKKRNGDATVSGNEACLMRTKNGKPYPSCRPLTQYRSIMQELDIPDGVATTSFYFSTPMQNETYKFHDYYTCNTLPCTGTAGCLGLDRQAMKSLCLNYMGSNGSNGYTAEEKGGVWLYFHNLNQPSQNVGSRESAEQGLKAFEQGHCSNIPIVSLSSGEIVSGVSVAGSSGSDFSGDSYSGGSGSGSGGGMDMGSMALQSGNIVNDSLKQNMENNKAMMEQQAALQEKLDQQKQFTVDSCIKTTTDACPNAQSGNIENYCSAPDEVKRSGCKFGEEA